MSWIIVEQDGQRRRIAVTKTAGGVWIGWQGAATRVAPAGQEAVEGLPANGVCAPMTGTICSVEVAPGDSVSERQLLVVMEAMKMQYRLTAPRAAAVEAVHCAPGDLVDLGATLVSLSP